MEAITNKIPSTQTWAIVGAICHALSLLCLLMYVTNIMGIGYC
jgi:hypothetical protein